MLPPVLSNSTYQFIHSTLLTHCPCNFACRDFPPYPQPLPPFPDPQWRHQPPPNIFRGPDLILAHSHNGTATSNTLRKADILYPLTFLILSSTHVSSPLTFSLAFLNFPQLLIDLFCACLIQKQHHRQLVPGTVLKVWHFSQKARLFIVH